MVDFLRRVGLLREESASAPVHFGGSTCHGEEAGCEALGVAVGGTAIDL